MEDKLKTEIISEGQFPHKRRKYQYQSIEDENMSGIRNMEYRYSILDLPITFDNKTVLDLGCSLGMVCIESKKRGAKSCVGLDNNKNTINVGMKYIKSKGYQNIELLLYDINEGVDKLIELIGDKKFDYVFALSIFKHVDQKKLFELINFYTGDICWFEGHSKQKKEYIHSILAKNLELNSIHFLGYTTDRGVRPNFRVEGMI